MAIINTLQKCLDSPYLFEDKEAPNRIVDLLAKAGDRLEAAVNIHYQGQGDPADIVFLSYEAMFSCVRALVYAKGYREFGLRCLMLACEGLYVRPGQLDPRVSAQIRAGPTPQAFARRGGGGLVGVCETHARAPGTIDEFASTASNQRLRLSFVVGCRAHQKTGPMIRSTMKARTAVSVAFCTAEIATKEPTSTGTRMTAMSPTSRT